VKIPEAQLRVFLVYVPCAIALTLAYFPDRNRETYRQNFACVSLVSHPGLMPSTLQLPRFYFPNPFDIFVFKVQNSVVCNIVYHPVIICFLILEVQ